MNAELAIGPMGSFGRPANSLDMRSLPRSSLDEGITVQWTKLTSGRLPCSAATTMVRSGALVFPHTGR
jgi:hypothetical protein